MKLLIMFLTFILVGCNSSSSKPPVTETDACPEHLSTVDYLVTGQSNAMDYVSPVATGVNWDYFEHKTGYKIYNISVGGKNIDWLRRNLDRDLVSCMTNVKGVFYIHGEADAIYGNPVDYKEDLRIYMKNLLDLTGASKVFVSSVGYNIDNTYDNNFDDIRNVQYFLINSYPNWILSFDQAMYFREWGMLEDHIHFNKDGDMMMMDGFIESVLTNQ